MYKCMCDFNWRKSNVCCTEMTFLQMTSNFAVPAGKIMQFVAMTQRKNPEKMF